MANLVQRRTITPAAQPFQLMRPDALMQPAAGRTLSTSLQTPQGLRSPQQVFGADRLQLNIPNAPRQSAISVMQQQASASSINRAIDRATGTQNTYNNRTELLVDGKEAFSKMRENIQSAQQSVYIEMFLFHGDETGWDMANLLVEKRKQGVDVKVLLDGIGQLSEDGTLPKFLLDNGVDVKIYNKQLLDWNNVNITHRKLVLVDGYKGITGGMNIGDEYAHEWHDLMVALEGESVQDLQHEFFVNWQKSGGRVPSNPPRLPQGVRFGNSATRVTVTSPDEAGKEKDTKNAFISAIHSSLKNVYLVNPYFSDEDVIQALIAAAQRGVEVRVLLPGISDNPVHAVLNKQNGERLIQAGAKVYKVDAGKDDSVFTHGKLMTIDGIWTTIGSTNLDTRALENNQELNTSITDARFAKTVEDRLFFRNEHALKPLSSDDFSGWERTKAKVFSFFDRVF